jgi:beta-lactamase regulating signal transducer with metallopeptidase domain
MNSAIITSWLLTYLVHSTILLGTAWLVSRALADRRLALQEILLRTALVGGLLTATLQVGFGVQPIGGALHLDSLSVTDSVASTGVPAAEATVGQGAVSITADSGARAESIWPTAVLSTWVISSVLALFVLGRSILDLRRLLKTRRFRPTGRLLDRLATAMGLRRTVRLSTSGAIAVPFATGIRRPEICCPERVGELASEHQKSLFAHELAHLARRDPAWQLIYRFGEALLFLQPLNRFVRRRLEEIAEHLTDERAVACTGNRLGLARCLVVVAHWGVADSPGVPATAFAAGPRLDRRVKRLISGTIGQHRSTRWTAPLLGAMLFGSVLLLPAVTPTAVHANLTPTGSDAATVQPWSPAKPAPETPATAVPTVNTPVGDLPAPVAPLPESVPAPEAAPRAITVPVAPAPPANATGQAPAAAPEPRSEPAPPRAPAPQASPTTPGPPQQTEEPAADRCEQRERAREEARERQREAHRERSEAEARAREEARARAIEAREHARQAPERSRMTDKEREELREKARKLARRAETEAREREALARERALEAVEQSRLTGAEREKLRAEAREHARSTRESSRLSDTEREEFRRRAEAARAVAEERMREARREARERARARAEEAEAKRRAEEERREQRKPE